MRILLSRTDSIGDVVLTLPMAGVIKKEFPNSKVHFLGRTYTEAVVQCSSSIDVFHNWDDLEKLDDEAVIHALKSWGVDVWIHVFPNRRLAALVKKAGIPQRIGTTGRSFHLLTCNRLVRFSRRRSKLHESQLNMKLLRGMKKDISLPLSQMGPMAAFDRIPRLTEEVKSKLDDQRFKIILHPKSKGSAVEWGLENFAGLIGRLNGSEYQIIVTGTSDDERSIGSALPLDQANVTNLLGKLSLEELIGLISEADCLVAASTGPLHLAGILNKLAIGLFSPRKPIHPGRWAPIGSHAVFLVNEEDCKRCKAGKSCDCIKEISPETVVRTIESFRSILS